MFPRCQHQWLQSTSRGRRHLWPDFQAEILNRLICSKVLRFICPKFYCWQILVCNFALIWRHLWPDSQAEILKRLICSKVWVEVCTNKQTNKQTNKRHLWPDSQAEISKRMPCSNVCSISSLVDQSPSKSISPFTWACIWCVWQNLFHDELQLKLIRNAQKICSWGFAL